MCGMCSGPQGSALGFQRMGTTLPGPCPARSHNKCNRAKKKRGKERETSGGGGLVSNEGQVQQANTTEFRRRVHLWDIFQVRVKDSCVWGQCLGTEAFVVSRAEILHLSCTLVSLEELKNQSIKQTKKLPNPQTLWQNPHLEQFRFNCSRGSPGPWNLKNFPLELFAVTETSSTVGANPRWLWNS